ncbi:MAG: protein kinase, partial [Lachnospiraceae bacterium]|nr:protein kinase [Lachnospiraceae bacterium]
MENSVSSISASVSRASLQEDISFFRAYEDDARNRSEGDVFAETITNERICKGDTFLDTYIITSDAIRGGMGSVWRVHHTGWHIDLAMKRPQPQFFEEGSERARAEFVEECEHWIRLGLHPNIVACYYVREIGGVPSIFSEWMDNGSLRDRIRDGSLYAGSGEDVQERILDIAIQTARGLAYSHENGLVHQDVKPGNLLLTTDWEAKVADFGLAKARTQITSRSAGYTLEYCPAQQAQGDTARPWMDIYAWAVSVLEMYAGKRLWETGAQVKERIREWFDGCMVEVPVSMQELLAACVGNPSASIQDLATGPEHELASMDPVLERLDAIYWQTQGREYPRKAAQAASETADSLNNYALSFLDLKQEKEAERYWDRALLINPDHQAAHFNRALYELRSEKKYDYQVLDDLFSHKSYWNESRWIRQEVGTPKDDFYPDRRHWFRFSLTYAHAALAGECLLISDVEEEEDDGGNPFIYRVHKETEEILETDDMQEIRKLSPAVAGIFIRPGGDRALVFLDDDRAALYDIAKKSIMKISEKLNLGYFMYDEGCFSRDGKMFVRTFPSGRAFVLRIPSLEYLWLSNCAFVGRMPGHGFVFRRYLPGINDVLFTVEEDGTIRTVFQFDTPPDLILEKDCDPVPFAGYACSETEKAFYLDENFSKIPLPPVFFEKLPPVRFFNPECHVLYTETSSETPGYMVAWDLDSQERLFTQKCPPNTS